MGQLSVDDALLRELLATNQQMLAELRRMNSKKVCPLSPDDHRFLAVLLPIVHAQVGNAVFTVRDLLTHAEASPDLAEAMGTVSDEATRKMGKLFARAAGVEIAGHRLERGVQLRAGLLWMVLRV